LLDKSLCLQDKSLPTSDPIVHTDPAIDKPVVHKVINDTHPHPHNSAPPVAYRGPPVAPRGVHDYNDTAPNEQRDPPVAAHEQQDPSVASHEQHEPMKMNAVNKTVTTTTTTTTTLRMMENILPEVCAALHHKYLNSATKAN